jgi:uncharacterized protein (DUF1919 family)
MECWNRRFSINRLSRICNNCIGGIIYHDLGLQFLTPTINLYFYAHDYIKFLQNFDKNIITSPKAIDDLPNNKNSNHPVGFLNGVKIEFSHYDTLDAAIAIWDKRRLRINRNNLFIIGSDRDFCTPEIVDKFHELPFKHKIFFSSKKSSYSEFLWFKIYKNESQVGDLIKDGRSWYFLFDIAHWLNTGEIKRTKFWAHFYFLSYNFGWIPYNVH